MMSWSKWLAVSLMMVVRHSQRLLRITVEDATINAFSVSGRYCSYQERGSVDSEAEGKIISLIPDLPHRGDSLWLRQLFMRANAL